MLKKIIEVIFLLLIGTGVVLGSKNITSHKIAVMVNDEIITSYEIIQRMKINAIVHGHTIDEFNNQIFLDQALDELIKQKLKKEKIIEYNITIDDVEFLKYEENFLANININKKSLLDVFQSNNISYTEFQSLLYEEISWQKLIGRLYYRLTSVTEFEVNEILQNRPEITLDQAKNIVIQRQLDLKSSKLLRDIYNEATIEYR